MKKVTIGPKPATLTETVIGPMALPGGGVGCGTAIKIGARGVDEISLKCEGNGG